MSVSTKNVKASEGGSRGGFVSKSLTPGNHKCHINAITLEKNIHSKFKNEDGSIREEWNIKLNLEGPALEGFTGFNRDFKDSSKGTYAGQQGFVRGTQYGLYTGFTKGGHPVNLEDDVTVWLDNFCTELGILEWFHDQNERPDVPDIHALVLKLNTEKPFAGKLVHFCLAAREYINAKNYTAHDLYIPRKKDLGRGFSMDETLVQKYIPSQHLQISKPKTVDGFSSSTPATTAQTAAVTNTAVAVNTTSTKPEQKAIVNSSTSVTENKEPNLFTEGNTDFLNQKAENLVGNPIVVSSTSPSTEDDLPFVL